MKETDKTTSNYISNLEDKIVELGLKLKSKENEFYAFQKKELQLFRKLNHNLKNPLGVIESFSIMVMEGADSISAEKRQKYLEIIQNSSNYSMKLLNNFTKYYTLKNSNDTLEESSVNLFQIILNEVEVLKDWALKRDIIIKIKEPKKEIYLKSNEQSLRSIIHELIHNAVRFSEDNSEVLIELIDYKNKIEIRIVDLGIGISEENLPKIYDEFFVCNTYAVDKSKCIGLGLSIAKTLANKFNGNLLLKSETGKGTIVNLSFKKD